MLIRSRADMVEALLASATQSASDDFFSEQFLRDASHNLAPAIGPALLALLVGAALVPPLILLAHRSGFVAHPRSRDLHRTPTPYLGGVALYAGFAAAVLAFQREAGAGLLLLGGGAIVVLLADDRWGMPPRGKLVVQLVLALAAVFVFDYRIEYLYLGPVQVPQLGLLGYPITVVWLVSMMNVINFLDGMDGLAGGLVAVTAVVLLIAAAGRQPEVVAMAGALAGSCVGFLVFNTHPARIFMGDAGAHFLGLTVALLSVIGVAKVAVGFAVLIPCLATGLPILDTALAIVRRRRRGLSIAHADNGHLHHRVLDLGFSQRETCVLFYGGSAIFGSVGLTVFGHQRILATVCVFTVVILSTVVGGRLHALGYRVPLPFASWLRARRPAAARTEVRKDRAS